MKITDDQSLNNQGVDAVLRAARLTPDPPSDFMARVLADALALQPVAVQPVARTHPAAGCPGLWRRAVRALGGGAGLAGLGTAALAGLVIGYVQPDTVLRLAEGFGMSADAASLDLGYGFDALLTEDIPL